MCDPQSVTDATAIIHMRDMRGYATPWTNDKDNTMPDWLEGLITFLGGSVVALIGAFSLRGRNTADAKKLASEGEATLSQATMAWAKEIRESLNAQVAKLTHDYDAQIRHLNAKLDAMAGRVTVLETENRLYREYTGLLINQIKGAGLIPIPQPPHPDGHSY
jgi:hypothetical protein